MMIVIRQIVGNNMICICQIINLYLDRKRGGIVARYEDNVTRIPKRKKSGNYQEQMLLMVSGFFVLWRCKMQMHEVELVGVGRKYELPGAGQRRNQKQEKQKRH